MKSTLSLLTFFLTCFLLLESKASALVSGQVYNIVIVANGKCIDVLDHSKTAGTRLQQWDCTGETQQKFIVNLVGADTYTIHPAGNPSLCLESSGPFGSIAYEVVQMECGNSPQTWKIEYLGAEGYTIYPNGQTFACFVVGPTLYKDTNGAKVTTEPCSTEAYLKRFYFDGTGLPENLLPFQEPAPETLFELKSLHSGKCLELRDWNPENGSALQQNNCNGQANQHFKIQKKRAKSGEHPSTIRTYEIVNRHSNRCISVQNFGTTDGTRIHNWDCYGNEDQAFVVERNNFEGTFSFKFQHAPNLCMDVAGPSRDNGMVVHAWSCIREADNQAWTLNPVR